MRNIIANSLQNPLNLYNLGVYCSEANFILLNP